MKPLILAAAAAIAFAPVSLAFAPMAAADAPCTNDVQRDYYDQACQNCVRPAIQAHDDAAYATCFGVTSRQGGGAS
jgi:hypothetical protein